MNKLVSIIVPIYNVEKYLDKCIKSITQQTYPNIEIILVDDGSTDNSGTVCDQYSCNDKRIIVIHKQNGGLSDARNAGIDIANGSYMCFVDGDDWIEESIIQEAVNEQERNNTDIVIWGYSSDSESEQGELLSKREYIQDPELFIKNRVCQLFFREGVWGQIGYAWNKLYKSELIVENQIRFEKGISLIEDVLFNAQVFKFIDSFSFLNVVGTHYIQRKRETLGTKNYENYFELKVRACNARRDILISLGLNPFEIEKDYAKQYVEDALLAAIHRISKKRRIRFRIKVQLCKTYLGYEDTNKCLSLYTTDIYYRRALVFLLKRKLLKLTIIAFMFFGG